MSSITITIIIIYVIIAILGIPLFIQHSANKYYKIAYNSTRRFCNNVLGWLISIIGKIRIGKSSLQSGLCHIFQIQMQNDILDLFDKTRSIYHKIDFNAIDAFLFDYFSEFENPKSFDQVVDILLEIFNLENTVESNYISISTLKKNFKDYAKAFHAYYIRNNYVASKTRIFSRITGKFNLEYNTEVQKINESVLTGDYNIGDYLVELADEHTDEYGSAKYYDDIKDESGAKEYLRKYGHLHRETNRFITTKQDVADEIKKYRKLTQSNIDIQEKVNIVGGYQILKKVLIFPLKILLFIVKFSTIFIPRVFSLIVNFFKFKKKKELIPYYKYCDIKMSEVSFKRTLKNIIYYVDSFFNQFSYCVYETKLFYKESDVDKVNSDALTFKFFIPITYCFGTYDTFEFNYLQDELLENSNDIMHETKLSKNTFKLRKDPETYDALF